MTDRLASLYQEINRRGQEAIAAGSEEIDRQLADLDNDHRRGLALIMHLPPHVTRNIGFALQELRPVEPSQYYYPARDMHLTVLDIIGARPDFNCPQELLSRYVHCIQRECEQTEPVDWQLAGLIASPAAVLVKGYYAPALASLRERLRRQIARQGLFLAERYRTASGHVTVARFTRPLQNRAAFSQILKKDGQLAFGSFTAATMDLVVHDWYNRTAATRLIRRFCLAGGKND